MRVPQKRLGHGGLASRWGREEQRQEARLPDKKRRDADVFLSGFASTNPETRRKGVPYKFKTQGARFAAANESAPPLGLAGRRPRRQKRRSAALKAAALHERRNRRRDAGATKPSADCNDNCKGAQPRLAATKANATAKTKAPSFPTESAETQNARKLAPPLGLAGRLLRRQRRPASLRITPRTKSAEKACPTKANAKRDPSTD